MADQELKIWAENINIDELTSIAQRLDLENEEFLDGWLRLSTVDAQQINQLFYLLTKWSNPVSNSPTLVQTGSIPTNSLEMNGQTIAEVDYPNAFALYGTTLPDITSDAPTGFTYVIRAH